MDVFVSFHSCNLRDLKSLFIKFWQGLLAKAAFLEKINNSMSEKDSFQKPQWLETSKKLLRSEDG